MVVKSELKIIQQRQSLILLEFFFGINRIYLLTNKKAIQYAGFVYTFFITMLVAYGSLSEKAHSSRHALTKYPPFTEETLLIIITLCSGRRKLEKFFFSLHKFDEILKIVNLITETKTLKIILSVYIILPIVECLSILGIFYRFTYANEVICSFFWVITHDCEQIFHGLNIRLVYLRITILKAHVLKMFSANSSWCGRRNLSQVEKLCDKTELDIGSLYKAYETLHKCSVELNAAMGYSLLIVFVTAATQVVISSNLVYTYLNTTLIKHTYTPMFVWFMSLRAVKFFVFTLLPSYYSRITAAQIMEIRASVYDVIERRTLDKTERNKLKSFLMLTRDCNLSYTLKGIVKLDKSLPLQFFNVCLTYIFISINFNKFIHAN